MQLAMIGLGRMGGNMTERLLRNGHSVVVFDRSREAIEKYAAKGATPANSLADMCAKLKPPRVIWIMVPAGKPVDDTLDELLPCSPPGDVIIDGGNSNYRETMRRGERVREKGLHLVDAGTSGGIWGLENGYCLMVGGDREPVAMCEPIFHALAQEGGYAHVGPTGAGHFTKMVHNGIEYGMLQAYAEGYEILHAKQEFKLDLAKIAELWNHGSVVRSWLNELAVLAFEKDAELSALKGYVEDSGEGRWTVQEAIDLNVPAPVITLSLLTRFRSRQADSFGAKVIAALRNEFGGHAVRKSGTDG